MNNIFIECFCDSLVRLHSLARLYSPTSLTGATAFTDATAFTGATAFRVLYSTIANFLHAIYSILYPTYTVTLRIIMAPTLSSATYSQGYKGKFAKMLTSALSRVRLGHFGQKSKLPPFIILNMGFGPQKRVAVRCTEQASKSIMSTICLSEQKLTIRRQLLSDQTLTI